MPWTEKVVFCMDCLRRYGDEWGCPDLVIPNWAWERITEDTKGRGILCPSCICHRLSMAGITCEGAFMSGPINTVSRPTMTALRRAENLEKRLEAMRQA